VTLDPQTLPERLAAFLRRVHNARAVRVDNLRLLTGGASRQTWAFDAVIERDGGGSDTHALVLRADPRKGPNVMGREVEYRLLEAADDAGVPVPRMHALGDDSLGVPFFLMERVEGETIARRILRDEQYAAARETMAPQLGEILAAVHRIDWHALDGLARPDEGTSPALSELERFEATYRAITPDPHPALELAFRWLRERAPVSGEPVLVHGDYRMGNLIVGPEGIRAVLDWELAHVGDPVEDLGWACVRSWRFGNDDRPVAGVGDRETFWRAYEAAGGRRVDPAAARWWEAFGNLRWGIICITQAKTYLDGHAAGAPPGAQLELATIGRRVAETEWELLEIMEGDDLAG
jgi:aminoglycoside phosphotransferase (APT) family kinase protein